MESLCSVKRYAPFAAVVLAQLAVVALAPSRAPASVGPAATVAAPRTAYHLDDSRTRYLAATEAVLVLALFGLLGWGPLARLSTYLPSAAPTATRDPDERGVGRFVRPRTGRAVRL